MKRAVVFEIGELGGLNDASQGAAAEQRIQAQVKAQKEEKLGPVKQGWKASKSGAKERTKSSGMARRPYLSSLINER